MNARIEPESKPAPIVNGQPPFTFPFGAGGLIMNGCFGSGYKPGDRCYDATWATTICLVSLLFLGEASQRGGMGNKKTWLI